MRSAIMKTNILIIKYLKLIFSPDQYDINIVINDSFKEINEDMIPVVEKVLDYQLKDILNKVLGHFNYHQIFPV